MERIKQWYLTNYTEITWFLIGFLTLAGLQELARGEYFSAAVSFVLVALNYSLSKQ